MAILINENTRILVQGITGNEGTRATKFMLASGIRENYSMVRTSERLMELYRESLIPKTYQDFEAALSGYTKGKIEAITVISRLKSLIDNDALYWGQFVEREKAIARFEALTGDSGQLLAISGQGEDKK